MKKQKLLNRCAISFFLLVFYTTVRAQNNWSTILGNARPAVVLVQTYNDSGQIKTQGIGFCLNDSGCVLTNYGLLEGVRKSALLWPNGQVDTVNRLLVDSEEHEIIALMPPFRSGAFHPLPLCPILPEAGSPVSLLGCYTDFIYTTMNGSISVLSSRPEFGDMMELAIEDLSSLCGSPVLNRNGEVVGMAVYKTLDGKPLNLAIPSSRIARFLQKIHQLPTGFQVINPADTLFSAEQFYNAGLLALDAKDYEKALDFFQKAAKRDPNLVDAYFQMGRCNFKLKRDDAAIAAYDTFLKAEPSDFDAHFNLGLVYRLKEDYTNAAAHYRTAVQIKPDAEAYNHLGFSLRKLKSYPDALAALNEAITLKNDYAMAYFNLGGCYFEMRQDDQALAAYQKAVQYNPSDAETYVSLANLYRQQEKYDEAIMSYKTALGINPQLIEAHSWQGWIYFKQGRFKDAVTPYEELVKLKPRDPTVHFNLGVAYVKSQAPGKALREYEILKEYDPARAEILYKMIYPQ